MTRRIVWGAIGFISANFVYQAFGPQLWSVAIERSFFQAAVCMWIGFLVWCFPPNSQRS